MFLASGSDVAALEQLLLGGDDGVHRRGGRVVGVEQRVHRGGALLSASLGWPDISVLTAPMPALAGARRRRCRGDRLGGEVGGVAVAAQRQCQPQRRPSRAGSARSARSGCSAGSAECPNSVVPRAVLSCGRTASRTGEVTSERLSLTVLLPAAASSRAWDTELAGNPQRRAFAEFGGPGPDETVDHLVGVGGLDVDRDAAVADRVRRLVELLGERLRSCRRSPDRRGRRRRSRRRRSGRRRRSERLDSASPKKRHKMTRGRPPGRRRPVRRSRRQLTPRRPGCDRPVAAGPLAAFPVAGVLRAGLAAVAAASDAGRWRAAYSARVSLLAVARLQVLGHVRYRLGVLVPRSRRVVRFVSPCS